ncbi:hypothetical protein CALVIDRAFT_563774 [Calocera viscosa TUFC12733]|uniref:Mid2 domain-containing protein n=1 Tax=Calocera viscosa (strain TUFC12733) TaxID=1330018 RepID=A0A167MH82_CALVF|nr:hypothetical protein CALVIDRAFT_563774 [Calocera viscosa TUFC12733]
MLSSRRSRALVGLLSLAAALEKVHAQGTTNATCTRNFWEYNDEGQSPCLVWAQLQAVCLKQIIVTPLNGTGYQYYPPYLSGQIDDCNCNVVSYNLMAGCSWCQTDILSSNWVSESTWASGCTSYDSTGIPSDVEAAAIDIPSWAFLPSNGSVWVPQNAQAVATGAVTPTATLPTSTGSSGVSSTGSLHPSASGGGQPEAPVPVAAIAGGVAGGVVALIALALLVWYLLRRRRQLSEPRTPVDLADPHPPDPSPYFLNPLPGARPASGEEEGKPSPGASPAWAGGYAYAPVSTGWEGSSPPLSTAGHTNLSMPLAGGAGGGERDALGIPRMAPPSAPLSALSAASATPSGSSTPSATAGHSPASVNPARMYDGGAGAGPALPTYEQARAAGGSEQARSLQAAAAEGGKRPRSGGSGGR